MGFFVLTARLVELQIIKGAYFRSLSEGNRIRRVPIVAPRGKILARGGEVLVGNIEVERRLVFDTSTGYQKLEDTKGVADDEIITEWVRQYKLGDAFAHVSGYLGEVNETELGRVSPECPEKGPKKLGSQVGRGGLEEVYECQLQGINGEELVEVDSKGDKVRILGRRDVIPGFDIKTTIHYGLQKKVAQTMAGNIGAIVVTDARGEVLALFSSPTFDPNIFVKGTDQERIKSILTSNDMPLFNRAIGGIYPPGSVFKPVVAVAALEEGKVDASFTFDDPGVITIDTLYGKFSYSNWYFTQYGRTEGVISIVRAMARSTDTFFYNLGELVGVEKIDEWAHEFGLDTRTGIDLPSEVPGLVPSPSWKEETRGERWFLGNTYHLSIGQGDIAVTPLGINQAISALAAGGIYCTPHIVSTEELQNFQCDDLDINQNTTNLVKEGMKKACSQGGTGFTFFDFEEKSSETIACKTGTAETGDGEKTHAWFTAFSPIDFPELVATVLVEKGGEGAYVAGPIAREIFDYWFDRNN